MAFNIDFGNTLRNIGIEKDFGVSEFFGGNPQSKDRQDLFGSQNVQGPLPPKPELRPTVDNGTVLGDRNKDTRETTNYFPTNPSTNLSTGVSNAANTYDTRVQNFNAGGVTLGQDSQGNILGLSDLKSTQGYKDFANKNPGATGQDYLDWLNGGGQSQQEIDALFGEGQSFLNSVEQGLLSSKDDFLNQFTGQFDAQVPLVQQASQEGLANINSAKTNTQQGTRSALDSARSLFNELSQRNRQTFGSGALSSAGQAASEILGRTASQEFGRIRQEGANAIRQLESEARSLEEKTAAQLQALDAQKQSALSQAQIAFKERLDQINAQRFELSQQKAQAKLEELRNFRAQVQAINAQAQQFAQSLQAAKQQADLQLRNAFADTVAQNQLAQGKIESVFDVLKSVTGGGLQNISSGNSFGGFSNSGGMNPLLSGGYSTRDEDERFN